MAMEVVKKWDWKTEAIIDQMNYRAGQCQRVAIARALVNNPLY